MNSLDSSTPAYKFMDAVEANQFGPVGINFFKTKYHRDSWLLQREAMRRGLRTTRLGGITFSATDGGAHWGFRWTAGSSTSPVVRHLTHDKQVCRLLLRDHHVPTAAGRSFPLEVHRGEVLAYAESLGFPVVVKPRDGTGGKAVSVGIESSTRLDRAIDAVGEARYKNFLVEQHVVGTCHRVFATRDRALSVSVRRPASVIGDGRSTVRQLATELNEIRSSKFRSSTSRRPLTEDVLRCLAAQEKTLTSVPEEGERVYLSRVDSVSQGAENAEVYDITHPEVLEVAARAVSAIPGLQYAGVDLILEDCSKPLSGQSVAVCEINSNPSIRNHAFPLYGEPRNVAEDILDVDARLLGVNLGPVLSNLSVRLRSMVDQPRAYKAWLENHAGLMGVAVDFLDRREVVEVSASGPVDAISLLTAQAIYGPDECAVAYVDAAVEDGDA